MTILTAEQELIRDTAQNFAKEHLLPYSNTWDETAEFPVKAISALGKLGFMGITIPEEYGGAGSDHISYVLAMEEIAAGDASCSTIMSVNNSLICPALLHYGNSQQKEKFLKPVASGQAIGAFCLTEPQAGSDAAAITASAEKNGDNYILNGCKQFISSGANADFALVIVSTNKSLGKKGLSAFMVETSSPGYKVAKIEKKFGQRCSDTAQLVFENLQVPRDNLLGGEGDGYKIALSNLEVGRLGIAAQAIGMAQAAYQYALTYAKERVTFNKPIIEHQAIAFRLAEMATNIEAAHALTMAVAVKRDANIPCRKEASMAKLVASEMAEKVCSQAMQIFGGYGYINESKVEQIYRDVRVTTLYEGTSDIQKMVISKAIMQE